MNSTQLSEASLMQARPLRVAIGAGGTGGHIYPGLAVAQALQELHPAAEITFFGARGRLEEKIVPQHGYPLYTTTVVGSVGKKAPLAPFLLASAALRCSSYLRRWGAHVVLGMGGYPSLPVVFGARFARLPIIIHEANAVAGRANQLASRFTKNIAVAHVDGGVRLSSSNPVRALGMPLLKQSVESQRPGFRSESRRAFGASEEEIVVLVCGGSLGAQSITNAAISAALLAAKTERIRFIIKTGASDEERAQRQLANVSTATAYAYIDRMDQAYAAADIVVGRSGASTVAELAEAGLASILIPYPHAIGDHQRVNAQRLVRANAAVVLEDDLVDGPALLREIVKLTRPGVRERMGAAARGVHRPDAAEELARWAISLAYPDNTHQDQSQV
ncbi:UDP-N-acetylglucosamine--N-acetylmuramyl-(pentapeptide) pyrophosphoryl-undecaprenol N-acetylglucosamine transferase [Lysinibacter sp. HNR]|uniref:UDP-N-acetylglucosamine--N-acetylmuramyl- (pentapeptide) pyrophosphoryl-undecaprenol N-acetylglucosamine transferase n=1 Tax=Lysinibacter sp. HNR TaxID=3031408 RepID=UPI0024349CCD|nr:UDP-N-acetylglucosamine--N-acetylmuramyl-(pentapeptide) pyrophosphoryl-undecaprenol N-acetylglucosamine transferase [Lysinibacter sp. HNR]WGD37684.1 UDP-N-acetylglucosamine--N-acetylmuramyl-(pentapeptide) pyrophosphoryl-undecaprenol N-acetylglucosamine transferase [Lysinibacter sp. HNR]